jgi:tRNA A-37 threonylcarbamoyl transferase component Bud32
VGRGILAVGAIAVVGSAVLLGYGLTRKPPTPVVMTNPKMAQTIDALADVMASNRSELKASVETMAKISQLRFGVCADAITVQDVLGQEVLTVKSNDVLDVGQRKNSVAVRLASSPPGSSIDTHQGVAGEYLMVDGLNVLITRVIDIVPDKGTRPENCTTDEAYLAVQRTLDLKPFSNDIAAIDQSVVLAIAGKDITLGRALGAKAVKAQMPLRSDPSITVTTETAAPVATMQSSVPMIAGGLSAGLGVLLLVVGFATRKAPGDPRSTGGLGSPGLANTLPVSSTSALTALPSAHAATMLTQNPLGSAVSARASSAALSAMGAMASGTVIGKWQITQLLGSGGMADVYAARSMGEAGFAKVVALKVMHPHLARNETAVEHFLDEARLAAQINHPNVVQIYDLGKIGDDYVIVMEHVDGVDLDKLLQTARAKKRQVPLNVAFGILRRVIDGIAAAHNAVSADGTPMQIVHRDVKSANVLISRQGGVRVMDFGIAKAAVQSHLTAIGETKGTPSMMAPEQRMGEPVDKRADVYSLAAVGYELLTGHAVNLDLAALAHLGIDGWPHLPKPTHLRTELPPAIDTLLLSAMSFKRENRPATCEEFEATLEAIAESHGGVASDKDIGKWMVAELAG